MPLSLEELRLRARIDRDGLQLEHPSRSYFSGSPLHQQSQILSTLSKGKFVLEQLKEAFLALGVDLRNINPTLLFRASEHGFSAAKFHKFCDNKGPTLLLVHTAAGSVFGAMICCNYSHHGRSGGGFAGQVLGPSLFANMSKSPSGFLFSLEEPGCGIVPGVPYHFNNPAVEVQYPPSSGPMSGTAPNLHLCDQCHIMVGSSAVVGDSFGNPQGAGESMGTFAREGRNFKVVEYEVWGNLVSNTNSR